jgi:hypothetical protein
MRGLTAFGRSGAPTGHGTSFGPELVPDGQFNIDTSNWTPTNATLSVAGGAMRVTNTAGNVDMSDITITTIVGTTYIAKGTFVGHVSTGNTFFSVGTSAGGVQYQQINMGVTLGVYSITFMATTTTTHISFAGSSISVAADTFDIDNVSLMAVN